MYFFGNKDCELLMLYCSSISDTTTTCVGGGGTGVGGVGWREEDRSGERRVEEKGEIVMMLEDTRVNMKVGGGVGRGGKGKGWRRQRVRCQERPRLPQHSPAHEAYLRAAHLNSVMNSITDSCIG